jgi:serine/threonine protein kinase/Tol biopolymer transport system component
MALTIGTQLGSHEIIELLGKGGMGEVYRARDLKLKREVAIKILPEEFSRDADRVSRFQREAEVLASLNHPNIAAIHHLEETNGTRYLVLELVEGETLADRIARGPVPVEEALLIAKQICDAVQAAHDRGVIHRDLKPANIKLAPGGKVKVLDFGLAKALTEASGVTTVSNSPTLVSGSMGGVIIGTAAYMSPEQARGTQLDARTDIWSFGCILYELLTAKAVFTGATVTDIIAKVIEAQPDWNLLPSDTPLFVRTLLESTLAKDRNERLQHIGDARVFLKVREIPSSPTVPAARAGRRGKFLSAALVIALAGSLVPTSLYFLRAPEEKPEVRFEIAAPGISNVPAISHDGRSVAYVLQREGKTAIWIRPMGELQARILPGTDNGLSPFWSPDDRYLAFFADDRLKKIAISGGPPTTLADTPVTVQGDWNRDGIILFSAIVPGSNVPAIVRISESGGPVTPVTKPGDRSLWPQFLPDGRHFLYFNALISGEQPVLFAGSLDGALPIRIMALGNIAERNYPGRYSPPGYLLFVRDGVLMAQGFDAKHLKLTGEPITIAEPAGAFGVSEQGTVVYQRGFGRGGRGGEQLVWIDRDGKPGTPVGTIGNYVSLRLSPDGHRVAVDPTNAGNRDIWVIDLERGIPNRLTTDPAEDLDPIWSPDGKRIVFLSSRKRDRKIFVRSAISIGGEETIDSGSGPDTIDIAADWSLDGKYLVLLRSSTKNQNLAPAESIWIKPMSGDGKPFPYIQSESFRYDEPHVSPNGRWLAYATNESGIYQIVVQTFPDPLGDKSQVTVSGGIYPTWRGDSRELYYIAPDRKLMSVSVKDGAKLELGEPKALFQTPLLIPRLPTANRYDASPDGKRFLFIAPADAVNASAANTSDTITAIVNWTAALHKK